MLKPLVVSKHLWRIVLILAGGAFLATARGNSRPDSATTLILFGCGALITACAVFFLDPFGKRTLLRERKPMSPREIFAEYYAQSGLRWDSFEHHWLQIAERLGESPQLLRPADRFDNELKPRSPLDVSNGDLVFYVQEELGNQVKFEEIKTLDSLIKLLCSKEQSRK